MYARLVAAARLIFGLQMTLSGLNWFVKFTLYPSIADFAHAPPPDDILGAMVRTGVMFHAVKGVELATGLLLLSNRWVPLALVVGFPVTVGVFMADVFSHPHLRGLVMGTGAFAQNVFLLFAYLPWYRPMLVRRASFVDPPPSPAAPYAPPPVLSVLGAIAVLLGLADLAIIAGMSWLYFTR